MDKLFVNGGDPDQMLHSAVSDLGLHCLPIILLVVSRLKWVKSQNCNQYISNKSFNYKFVYETAVCVFMTFSY